MTEPMRLTQVYGEWLLTRDLRDAPLLPARRLAQHQIAAHRTWGCSAGLDVRCARGRLTVTPGCGIDRCGRTAVLDHVFTTALAKGTETAVVLVLCGDGPRATVRLRPAARVHDLDIRLGKVDSTGAVFLGDGDRDWLRRPGPARQVTGTVARGAPATGNSSLWKVHVKLTAHQLPSPPAVIAFTSGPPERSSTTGTTVDVTGLNPSGFDLVVRHSVPVRATPPRTVVLTAPHALSWIALLPAERPSFANP